MSDQTTALRGPTATPAASAPVSASTSQQAEAARSTSVPEMGRRRQRAKTSLFAAGEPLLWLTGGALAICTVMVAGLLLLVLWQGLSTFWPQPVVQVDAWDGTYAGEITRHDDYHPPVNVLAALPPEVRQRADALLAENEGWASRELIRTGNYRLTQSHFHWVSNYEAEKISLPEWAMVVERLEWGRFYGFPEAFAEMRLISETASDPVAETRTLIAEMTAAGGSELRLVTGDLDRIELLALDRLAEAENLRGVAEMAVGEEAAWRRFQEKHGEVRQRWIERRRLEEFDTGEVNHRQEQARLAVREAEIELAAAEADGDDRAIRQARGRLEEAQRSFAEVREWANDEFSRIRAEIDAINRDNARFQLVMRTPGEGSIAAQTTLLRLDDIVRAYPANRIGFFDKVGLYLGRWGEFLTDEPREANSEGGVFPAIFGTVAMTLIMSLAVVPFGVLAALYLNEYATAGPIVSAVRIAVNNLAGVPSIVFGVFGLGFFCYVVGASLDELFFAASLPNPTFGKGGLLWASLTLALLTLPVVIVATEEAVQAVPNSMREGSYACGASKWQTIQRIVLPRALPGIITGMVLAIARGAGEVAPLMLVGAVKLAPELPIDGLAPFIHPERSFMHLGFHIYDVGFQSQNSEAAKPMVYTTTMLLIGIIAVLNLATIWLRSTLRKKFAASKF